MSLERRTIITFGTFDLLHLGHLRIMERARQLGDRLVVGVSSDELNRLKKGCSPTVPQEERMALVAALRCVDEVFLEESLDAKGEYLKRYGAQVLVMGDDWTGRMDQWIQPGRVAVVYLPRTPNVSTTERRSDIISTCADSAARSQ